MKKQGKIIEISKNSKNYQIILEHIDKWYSKKVLFIGGNDEFNLALEKKAKKEMLSDILNKYNLKLID